ncbi:MAG: helix-turn-helix transcriptional regulator [Alicyclobacillaceae bacterium]|nr:helix-turn-helix transcriptional regulator [Alicyclobacillaceae bacterium]
MKRRDWLVQLRVRKGLTHEQVARMAEIERSTYTKAENGAPVRVKTAKKIAAVLDFPWVLFYDEKYDRNEQFVSFRSRYEA